MSMNKEFWWNKTRYCLIIFKKKNNTFSRRYYGTYDDMYDASIYVQFSPNCVKARGMVFEGGNWKTYFTIG